VTNDFVKTGEVSSFAEEMIYGILDNVEDFHVLHVAKI
jgi:hypothetical protein